MARCRVIPLRAEGVSFPFPATSPATAPSVRRRPKFTRLALLLLSGLISLAVPDGAAQAQTAPSAWPAASAPYAAFIADASQRFGVPAAWIRAVMRVESGGDQRAISPAGAMGLMQIMPETWADLRLRYGLGHDPFDPHDNILAGAAFLREMHDRYGSPGFLAAYNAGPNRYEDYRDRRRPLPSETVAYIAELLPLLGNSDVGMVALGPVAAARSWTDAPLFVQHSDRTMAADQVAPNGGQTPVPVRDVSAIEPQSEGLFIALAAVGKAP